MMLSAGESANQNLNLQETYDAWKSSLQSEDCYSRLLGPPLLLSVNDEYADAQIRVLVIGQETFGWQWTRELRALYPEYAEDWPFADISSWSDFLRNADAVKALRWAYWHFAFGLHQPQTYRSPFWTAFREIGAWPNAGAIWSNLVRSDYENGSILAAPFELQDFLLKQEGDLLTREIEILRPDVCIFFTGPNYDFLIDAKWPNCKRTAIDGCSEHQLARLVHERLPVQSYRLYHPAYLRRSGNWHLLDILRDHVLAT